MNLRSLSFTLLLALVPPVGARAQAAQPAGVSAGSPAVKATPEDGTFILHKFAKAIGKETYRITVTSGGVALSSDFLFTDRGSAVPLKTTYTATPALEPVSLALDGRSSRLSVLKDELMLDPREHRVALSREGKTTFYPAPENTFLIDGYSPVAMQEMLMRFWLAHGRPAQISTPPGGSVHVEPAGDLAVSVGGAPVKLHGYVLTGLIWGAETLWLDDHDELAALISTDSEFDHFEAVRERFEPAFPTFVQAAAQNSLNALTRLSAQGRLPVAKKLAITNVTVIDGTGSAPVGGATVFVENGQIVRVERTAHPSTRGSDTIDGTGKFLIPGLWDMHAHYEQVEWGPIYLAAGVTTVRDCGNEFDFITTVRDALNAGRGIGPQLLIAGIVDGSGPASLGAITADTPEEAVAVVRRYKAAGALQIKIYSSLKPELVPVIAQEAHRLGMTVTGHVPNGMSTAQAVEAGYDMINHIQYPARDFALATKGSIFTSLDFSDPAVAKLIALLKSHGTVIDDTLTLFEKIYRPASVPLASLEPGITHVAPQLAEALNSGGVPEAKAPRATQAFQLFLASVRELHKDGVTIVAGTDQDIPGYSLHRELELYVKAGFTPMEALEAATSVPARVMKMDKVTGTIEPGKRADMVLLDADPLVDISNSRRIARVIASGAVYDPAPLWQSVGFTP